MGGGGYGGHFLEYEWWGGGKFSLNSFVHFSRGHNPFLHPLCHDVYVGVCVLQDDQK